MIAVQSIVLETVPEWASTLLMTAAVALGAVICYLNRDGLGDIEEEKRQEEVEEKRREMGFAGRYPRLNRARGVRWVGMWMYKEGGWYIGTLIFLVFIGFYLRIFNIAFLSPVTDEYYHLVGAKRFMLEGYFNYSRASFLTYIIGYLFKLNGGTSLFLGRLPTVIFGTLSIIAIYFLGKKINKKIGLISSYLLTFSPLAIGMSRYIREYQPYFLFIILFLIYFIYILKKFNSPVWRTQNKTSLFLESSVIILPIIYYFFIEKVTIIYVLYMIFFIFALVFLKGKYQFNFKLNKQIYLIVLFILIILFIVGPVFLKDFSWLIKENEFGKKEIRYEDALFKPDWDYRGGTLNIQWFSGLNFTKFFAVFIFIFPLLFLYKNKYFISCLLAFFSIFLPFLYIINQYFAPRYVYNSLIFYIIVFSCSIFSLYKLNELFTKQLKWIYIILISIILISFFNPITAVIGLINEKNGEIDSKTEFYHDDIAGLFELLNNKNFSEKEILVTANDGILQYYYNYSFINNEIEWPLKRFDYKGDELVYDYGNFYHYDYSAANSQKPNLAYLYECKDLVCEIDENELINKIIQKYETGYIVIDKDRNQHWNKRGFPLENYTNGNRFVEYKGNTPEYRGFELYQWKTLQNESDG